MKTQIIEKTIAQSNQNCGCSCEICTCENCQCGNSSNCNSCNCGSGCKC